MPPSSAPSASLRPRYRGPILLLGAVAAVALLFLLGEGFLRLTGIGELPAPEASRLKYQQVFLPMMEKSTRTDGTEVWITSDRRLPYQSALIDKPAGSLRIFIVGGSASAGLGYSPNVTFGRQLEYMLQQSLPEREVEVVNLSIVALSSAQVRWIVDDVCQNYSPDLVIVYSGNNEFLETHAAKYASATGSLFGRVRAFITNSSTFRLLQQAVRGNSQNRNITVRQMAAADSRIPESEIISKVHISDGEFDNILGSYQANIEAMAASTREAGVPLLLMTVASNWCWRGTEDLPADWIPDLLGVKSGSAEQGLELALDRISEEQSRDAKTERYGWLFKRGLVNLELERLEEARNDLRSAMNQDPHLRRATDMHADRVRLVAKAEQVPIVDTISFLEKHARHGIIGFDEFYDYVHFTPRGSVLVAAELYRSMERLGYFIPSPDFDLGEHVSKEIRIFNEVKSDPLEVGRWMGLGSDTRRIHDRDLWKHQRAMDELDLFLVENPGDFQSLVWRGNADFFRIGGFESAREHYQAAITIDPDHSTVLKNLELLLGERRALRSR